MTVDDLRDLRSSLESKMEREIEAIQHMLATLGISEENSRILMTSIDRLGSDRVKWKECFYLQTLLDHPVKKTMDFLNEGLSEN